MIVTCWYRDLGDGPRYSHYSCGYDPDAERPPYMFESQRKAWADGVWVGRKAELDDRMVIRSEDPWAGA